MGKKRSVAPAGASSASPLKSSQGVTNATTAAKGTTGGGGSTLCVAKAMSGTHSTMMHVCMALLFACAAMTAQVYFQKHYPDSAVARKLAPYFRVPAAALDSRIAAAVAATENAAEHTKNSNTGTNAKAGADAEENTDAVGEDNIPVGANSAGKPREVDAKKCSDRHAQCPVFQAQGECENNPGWMIVNCPDSCNACDMLDPKVRCNREKLGIQENHVYDPGDMDAMFAAIEKTYPHYGITVHSKDPWVVTFDNFLSDVEVDALITSVDGNWERSTDTGSSNEFGETGRVLSTGRTSNNAWCRQECLDNRHVQNVMKKIEEVTWVPQDNYESFQVLRYEIGQEYKTHHDASSSQTKLACGTRILTFFLYLSDVDEGGETAFPTLDIAIKPKKGSALLWPSTRSDDVYKIDQRTLHQARPVIKGTKFAANTWIHSHNYAKPNLWGCTGTFDELSN